VADVQMILFSVSMVSLAVAHYLAYRKGAGGRGQRPALWLATPLSIALWVLPRVMR